ncbi:hypothetical protein LJC57_10190, partial [Parabacteroides sp. OttesenSCG-928-G07]|nr:hypothetical protein [Parabacteroides sp. OttesenSCG-928-G07]
MVIVIANYDENGLTQTLMDVKNWEELKSVLTPDIQGEHLHTPLLMYGAATITLANGATEQASIRLSRVVARLDVVNEAAVPAEPE